MYGTIGKWTVKDGHMNTFLDLVNTYQPPAGFVSMTLYQSVDDANVIYAAVVFESRDAYYANADSDSQHQFYTQTLEHLVHEPEWTDGDIVGQVLS